MLSAESSRFSAWVEDQLRAAEEGYGLAALLVGDFSVPHLRRAAAVDEFGTAGDRASSFRTDEVALELYGGEALGAVGKVYEGAVAARGIGEGYHRRRVQIPVRGHELLAKVEAAGDPTLLGLPYLEPDETR